MPSITLACTFLHAFILYTAFQKPSTSFSYKSRANDSALALFSLLFNKPQGIFKMGPHCFVYWTIAWFVIQIPPPEGIFSM